MLCTRRARNKTTETLKLNYTFLFLEGRVKTSIIVQMSTCGDAWEYSTYIHTIHILVLGLLFKCHWQLLYSIAVNFEHFTCKIQTNKACG